MYSSAFRNSIWSQHFWHGVPSAILAEKFGIKNMNRPIWNFGVSMKEAATFWIGIYYINVFVTKKFSQLSNL